MPSPNTISDSMKQSIWPRTTTPRNEHSEPTAWSDARMNRVNHKTAAQLSGTSKLSFRDPAIDSNHRGGS
ncbi:hypothetical protein MYCTH_2130701 [Thermothelomyces thermophilus ATCC 42464]|uniref:Uncharacterized protein n=1 Tax=Thermothelomyces thermophilus (strain ATCC 42464 / BCRC 31852 / DSM 1799) TaxID=573729 RepID=G2QPL6_THET4|nr:uncharacterized protein MYCTH_2130701 [Thermothelomyces thermophilus ATCC 42464]AEO61529.1 hypothetical protein MYCTH_2130701 [Thermothelomyces thermophilus ATCC 42464]